MGDNGERECYLDYLLVEVRVVHVEDGSLDMPGGRKPIDLYQDVVGPALVQHIQLFLLLFNTLQEEKWSSHNKCTTDI